MPAARDAAGRCLHDRVMNPAIVLVSPEHAAHLADEFGRYVRDYDIHTTTTVAEAEDVARTVTAGGRQVALFVAESQLPDAHVLEAFARWRAVVPTARRLVAAHHSRFLTDAPDLRAGLVKGKYDAYLLMPRGVRDEEFHTAVSSCCPTGARRWPPRVESVRIVSPDRTPYLGSVTSSTGWDCRTGRTDRTPRRAGRSSRPGGDPTYPLVVPWIVRVLATDRA